MKKYLFCIAALLTAAVACTYEPVVPEENNKIDQTEIVPESTAAPVLYASFETNEIDTKAGFTYDGAGHYDHYWNAGDHIYVFPKEDRYDIYNCTDASAGAFTLLKDRTGSATAMDKAYAIYNSELSDDGNEIDDGYANMWTSTPPFIATPISWNYTVAGPDKNGAYGYNNIMIAAVDDLSEKLVFKSCVGWLRLQLKGTQKVKSIKITSNVGFIFPISMSEVYVENMAGTPNLGYEDGLNGLDRKLSISAPYAQLNTSTPTDFYITLPPCTMSKGFILTIEYADGTSQTINTTEQVYQIKRNTVLKLPERTVGTTISNLSSAGTANCYIVQSAGNKKFNASVKGNSLESVGTPLSAKVLWESFNTHTAPNPGDIITNVTYLDGYVYFRVPFTNKGNAVIAVYDGENGTGNILWSWHIWVTDIDGLTTPVDLTAYAPGLRMMKASLGTTELSGVPLYYQWGRKDPFYRYATYNVAEYIEGTVHPTSSYGGSVSVANSIKYPTSYYYAAPVYYWDNDLTPAERINLWKEDSKTIYDPCPSGWKVMNASDFKTAIDTNGLNSGLFNFGAWGSLISFTTGELMGGISAHWTSNAYLDGEAFRVDYMNHNGGNYGVAQEVFTSAAYPVRCEKM